MHLDTDLLSESLDVVADWAWVRRSRIEWEAAFDIDGTNYLVSFFDTHGGAYEVNFGARADGEEWHTQHVSGTGNAGTVYATVIAIIVDFEQQMGPAARSFIIESDLTERNRHRVNQHIAKRLQQRFEGEYHIEDRPQEGTIILKRVDEPEDAYEDEDEDEKVFGEALSMRDAIAIVERRAAATPEPFNPKQIDPALLTYREYYKIANEDDKHHPDEAYTTTLAKFAEESYLDKSKFPQLLKRVKLNGLYFEFRVRLEPRRYAKWMPDGYTQERGEDGQPLYMSDDEVAAAGLAPHDFIIGIYDEEGRTCGAAQDEWGCILIRVANEYKGFGLGVILSRLARHFEPGKTSGGFTNAGLRTFVKVHREAVRDALTSGRYGELIRNGQLTTARVKEIVASADLSTKLPNSDKNLSSKDPRDWLLYAADGAFVLYDRKLREVVAENNDDVWDWGERMIKGYILVRDNNDRGIVVRFGADRPGLKSFMLTLAASWCAHEGIPFYVDAEDIEFVDTRRMQLDPMSKQTGISRAEAHLTEAPIDYEGLARQEAAFRKSFDRYGEFHNWLLDLADRKFRPEG
jgi:hypothetical protein